jgi:hypothetical protein
MSRNYVKPEEDIPPARLFRIKIDEYSQPYILRDRMHETGLSHGQTILANLKNVRLDENGVLYFCPMGDGDLEMLERISAGDGAEIPDEVVLIGNFTMKPFMEGFFNLKNVGISSNGSIQVIARPETAWEKVIA